MTKKLVSLSDPKKSNIEKRIEKIRDKLFRKINDAADSLSVDKR